MNKKIRHLLTITSILLALNILVQNKVLAANISNQVSSSNGGIFVFIFMELFCSIHMSLFVLLPLAKIISKNKSTITFCILFVIRVILLAIGNSINSAATAIIDFLAIFIGAFILIPVITGLSKELGIKKSSSEDSYTDVPDHEFDNIGIKDPSTFKKELINKFINYEEAYCNQDYTYLKKNTSDNLYKMLEYGLNLSKEKGITSITTDIEVIDSKICSITNNKDYLEVCMFLKASILDYSIDISGNVTEGSTTNKKTSEYIIVFEKTFSNKLNLHVCSNCGSPITATTGNYCKYCGSLLTKINNDWIIRKCTKLI